MVKSEYSLFSPPFLVFDLSFLSLSLYDIYIMFIQIYSFHILFIKKQIMLCLLFCNLLSSLSNHEHFPMSVYIALPHLFSDVCYVLVCGCATFYLVSLLRIDIYNPDFFVNQCLFWDIIWSKSYEEGPLIFFLFFFLSFSKVTVG